MDDKDKVIKTLKESETALKSGEIAELSGVDKNLVDKIIKVLVKTDLVASPKRCFYELKK